MIAIIIAGFYFAHNSGDIEVKNKRLGLVDVKGNVENHLSEAASGVSSGIGVIVEETKDQALAFPSEALSDALVSSDSLLVQQTLKKSVDKTNLAFEQTTEDSVKSSGRKHEKEIIELYKEVPEIFDIKILKEYLDDNGYSGEDYIKAMCEQIE